MESIQFRELLNIAMAPGMKIVYYNHLLSNYNKRIFKDGLKRPPAPPEMLLDAAGDDAKDAVMSVFRTIKRGMGYG